MIIHPDQSLPLTSGGFVGRMQAKGIKISMLGRKSGYNNIKTTRLWLTGKYKEVNLHGYVGREDTERNITRFL